MNSPSQNDKPSDGKGQKDSEKTPTEYIHNFNSGIIRKSEYFDLFISYKRDNGGDHGQKLAEELHRKLTADGYKVWLDNEEIGFSNNFEDRIEQAILHSKKVACIIGPQWVESPNCRFEVKQAIAFEKRIIPIHYQEFRSLLKSKKDAGELTLDEWNRIDKPQEIDFSDKSKEQKGYEDLKAVCDLNDDVTSQHNRISCESYYWKKYDKPKAMLPFGTYLSKAKLLRSKCNSDSELPSFMSIQDEFLAAADQFVSSEVSHHRTAFISYTPNEYEFAAELNLELKLNGVLTWFHDLYDDANPKHNVLTPVINCDNLIEIVSEDSAKDDNERMIYARANNKRIIKVTESETFLDIKRAAGVKNIYLWNGQVRVDELITTINGDAVYNASHAKLLMQAFDWEKAEKSNSKLLPLKDANAAKEWYQKAEKAGTEPQPNLNMINFAERSVAYAETLRKRKRGLILTAILGGILILILGGFAYKLEKDITKQEDEIAIAIDDIKEQNRIADSLEIANKGAQTEINKLVDSLDIKERLFEYKDSVFSYKDSINQANLAVADSKLREARRKDSLANIRASSLREVITRDSLKNLKQKENLVRLEGELVGIQKDLDLTKDKTNAAVLSVEAYNLTRLKKYDKAKVSADSAFGLYIDIALKDSSETDVLYETDNLYNAYYSMMVNKFNKASSVLPFTKETDVKGNTIYAKQCIHFKSPQFNWSIVKDMGLHRSRANCVVYSEDKKFAALGSSYGNIYIFDLTLRQQVDKINLGTGRVTSIAYNADGSQIAASYVDKEIALIPLVKSNGKRNNDRQIIIAKTDMQIEEIQFSQDYTTILTYTGRVNDNGFVQKILYKYPATVEKLNSILKTVK